MFVSFSAGISYRFGRNITEFSLSSFLVVGEGGGRWTPALVMKIVVPGVLEYATSPLKVDNVDKTKQTLVGQFGTNVINLRSKCRAMSGGILGHPVTYL